MRKVVTNEPWPYACVPVGLLSGGMGIIHGGGKVGGAVSAHCQNGKRSVFLPQRWKEDNPGCGGGVDLLCGDPRVARVFAGASK